MVAKSSDDVVSAFDDLAPTAVFSWQSIGHSSLTTALGYTQGILQVIKTAAGALVLFIAYQAGTKGATGIVYQKSVDEGETWDGEVQISNRQTHASLAAVIHPTLYDIHFVYAVLGDPALGAGLNSLYRRVLAWGAVDWAVGAEATIFSGAAASGVTNVTMEPRISGSNGYLMALTHYHDSSNHRWVESHKATASWTLTSGNNDQEVQFVDGVEIRTKLLRDDTHGLWIVVVEQGGQWQLFTSSAATPPGEISLTPTQTWYEPSTAEFDAAVDPVTGLVGIVQNSANQILYRTYDPATDTLTDPVVVDDGTDGACYSPAITSDAGKLVVVYARTMVGNWRQLMAAWSNDWSAKFDLAHDPGVAGTYGAWGEVHLSRGTQDLSAVFMAWCDTVSPSAAGCRVFVGRLSVPFVVVVTDDVAVDEGMNVGLPVSDAAEADDTVKAGEDKTVDDTLAAADAFKAGPTVAEVIHATEAHMIALPIADALKATETAKPGPRSADTVGAADTVIAKQQNDVVETLHATDVIEKIRQALADNVHAEDEATSILMGMADTLHAVDLGAIIINIAETLHAIEALVIGVEATDTITADELVNMLYEVLDEITVTDEVSGTSMLSADTLHALESYRLEIHSDDALHAADTLAKLSLYRLLVHLLMHSGKVQLKLEGGGNVREE